MQATGYDDKCTVYILAKYIFFSDWFLQDTCSHNWLLHRLFLKNTTFLEKKARCSQLKPATHAHDLTFCLCRDSNPGLQIQDTCSPHWGHRLSPYEMALPIWISRQFKHPPSGPFGPPAWVVHSVSFWEFLTSFEWILKLKISLIKLLILWQNLYLMI